MTVELTMKKQNTSITKSYTYGFILNLYAINSSSKNLKKFYINKRIRISTKISGILQRRGRNAKTLA